MYTQLAHVYVLAFLRETFLHILIKTFPKLQSFFVSPVPALYM